jgi:hypothetical protein
MQYNLAHKRPNFRHLPFARFQYPLITKKHHFLFQAKDESIVRLTNQLHETELSNVMLAATVNNLTSSQTSGHLSIGTPGTTGCQPPTTPLGLGPKHPSLMRLHSNSNGISFDSDKGEFKEFIDVGSQTNEGSLKMQ